MPEDMAFDDGSEVEIEVEPEEGEPPDITACQVLEERTEEDEELGAFLGGIIDIDDDEDDGSKWAGVTKEEIEAMARANTDAGNRSNE